MAVEGFRDDALGQVGGVGVVGALLGVRKDVAERMGEGQIGLGGGRTCQGTGEGEEESHDAEATAQARCRKLYSAVIQWRGMSRNVVRAWEELDSACGRPRPKLQDELSEEAKMKVDEVKGFARMGCRRRGSRQRPDSHPPHHLAQKSRQAEASRCHSRCLRAAAERRLPGHHVRRGPRDGSRGVGERGSGAYAWVQGLDGPGHQVLTTTSRLVQKLRYKDYHLASRPAVVACAGESRPENVTLPHQGLFETHSVKDFGEQMRLRGVFDWWRRCMGWTGQDDRL
nr:hypothetical protein CFP56_30832 [Quercus suber]